MLQSMANEVDINTAKAICRHYDHIVHGDPIGAASNLVELPEDRLGYAVGKVLNNPGLCDEVCIQGQSFLIVLTARAISCFPEVRPPDRQIGAS
jgi:hypothetical protein